MGRLFEDAGSSRTRKWQCFCCGKTYTSYDEFKSHVLEVHEEGREYILCPVETCNCPVRDLKNHFKLKHPNRVMPKGLQTRAAIWKDFKPNGTKKSTRKPNFKSGTFLSKKSGKEFKYRSGMEKDFFNLLENDQDVASFVSEPFKVPYYHAGKWHDYTPDIRIDYVNGDTEIWEVKPANQTHYEQNKAKWVAMNNYAQNMGWEFVVQTEVGLGKLKVKVNRQG